MRQRIVTTGMRTWWRRRRRARLAAVVPLCLLPSIVLCLVGCSDEDAAQQPVTGSGAITVSVADTSGSVVASAQVTVIGDARESGSTGSDGRAVFTDVPAAAYRVLAWKEGVGGGGDVAMVKEGDEIEVGVVLFPQGRLAPAVNIWGPARGVLVASADSVELSCLVFDLEGPREDMSLVWSSDLDGVLHRASIASNDRYVALAAPVTVGRHLMTVAATNVDAFTGTDTVSILVTVPPPRLLPLVLQGGQTHLRWTRIRDAAFAAYEVWRSTVRFDDPSSEELVHTAVDPADTTWIDAAVGQGGVFYYRVCGRDRFGRGLYSNIESAPTAPVRVRFPFRISDAALHPSRPFVYLAGASERKVYMVDWETETLQDSLSFDFSAERLALADSPSGGDLIVTLLTHPHDWTRFDDRQSGYLAVVDLARFATRDVLLLDTDPYDVVVGRDGYYYIPSGSGQHSRIRSVPREGLEKGSSDRLYAGCRIELHPVFDRIYASGLNDRRSFEIRDGDFLASRDIPVLGRFAIDPSGTWLFTESGSVLACAADPHADLQQVASLGTEWEAMAFDADGNRCFAARGDGTIRAYELGSWSMAGEVRSGIEAAALFYRGGSLIVAGRPLDGSFYSGGVQRIVWPGR